MKTLKLLVLPLSLVLSLSVSSAFANEVDKIDDNDHAALAKHYENVAKEAAVRLRENQEMLQDYEVHPYYYGRQGQDLQSHTSANIHEYEEIVTENLNNADLHRRMIVEQQGNSVNKTKTDLNRNSIAVQ